MVKVSRSIIPSFFTIGNMFFGFYALIQVSKGNLELAVWLIFAGAVMDALDGKIARWANASSDFGVEYDSLADVVTFGVAPSYVLYHAYFADKGVIGIFIGFAPLLFGSLRLARFNIELSGYEKNFFNGLPIPTAAVTMTSFILFENEVLGGNPHHKFHLFLVLFVSFLMISNVKYSVMPELKLNQGTLHLLKLGFMVFGIILMFINANLFLFPLAALFVVSGLIGWMKGDRVPNSKQTQNNQSTLE